MSISLLFEILALICLGLAMMGVPTGRVSIGWAGMFLWLLAQMVGGVVLR